MSHFWLPDPSKNWVAWELLADAYRLSTREDGSIHLEAAEAAATCGAALLRIQTGALEDTRTADEWVLVTDDGSMRLNGVAIAGGIALLRNHDEILIRPALRAYYSTERLPVVTSFPHAEAFACPRCHTPIESGTPAVCCPSCNVWHHQSDQLPCWTHAPVCATCECKADLSQSFRWSPLSIAGDQP